MKNIYNELNKRSQQKVDKIIKFLKGKGLTASDFEINQSNYITSPREKEAIRYKFKLKESLNLLLKRLIKEEYNKILESYSIYIKNDKHIDMFDEILEDEEIYYELGGKKATFIFNNKDDFEYAKTLAIDNKIKHKVI